MSNLQSLHRQHEQLFRCTVKDSRRKRIRLQHLPWGIFYFNLADPTYLRFLLQPSQNPCRGLTPSQLHCVIIKVHHSYAAPWPWLPEKSAWRKHCGKGNPCPRRNSGGQMMNMLPAACLVFRCLLHSPVKIHQQLLRVRVAGEQREAGPRIQPVA